MYSNSSDMCTFGTLSQSLKGDIMKQQLQKEVEELQHQLLQTNTGNAF